MLLCVIAFNSILTRLYFPYLSPLLSKHLLGDDVLRFEMKLLHPLFLYVCLIYFLLSGRFDLVYAKSKSQLLISFFFFSVSLLVKLGRLTIMTLLVNVIAPIFLIRQLRDRREVFNLRSWLRMTSRPFLFFWSTLKALVLYKRPCWGKRRSRGFSLIKDRGGLQNRAAQLLIASS